MRILKFIVNKRNIVCDPKSNFSGIAPGTDEQFIADFRFSSEWDDTTKVVAFFNADGECPPQTLTDGYYCVIPPEALKAHWFRLQVLGKTNKTMIKTNVMTVLQDGR